MNIQDLLSGKVKLEFGNFEQMRVIDSYMEGQKGARGEKRIYVVRVIFPGSQRIEIEAQDEDEARGLALDEADFYSAELGCEVMDVGLKGAQ